MSCEVIMDVLYRIRHIGHPEKKNNDHQTTAQSQHIYENKRVNEGEKAENTEEVAEDDGHADASDAAETEEVKYETEDEQDEYCEGFKSLDFNGWPPRP